MIWHDGVTVALLAFAISFLFALGGVGGAVALVPSLQWMGLPLEASRSIGLAASTMSMTAASVDNIRAKRTDFRLGIPIIVTSFLAAPLGAWSTHWLPRGAILGVFTGFLAVSGLVLLFFRGRKFERGVYREDRPILLPALIGAMAGYLSGLLGVGGGSLIAPLMIWLGFNPKKVAAITAFVVPFTSLSALAAYLAAGGVGLATLAPGAVAAYFGGSLGTRVMHAKMDPDAVKKLLGILLLLMAAKMGWDLR